MSQLKNVIAIFFAFIVLTGYAQVKTLNGKKLSAKEIDAFIRSQMDSLNIPALSLTVIQNGKIAYYKATGIKNDKGEVVDSNTLFEAASMTKPVFAYALHKLVQEGKISLDTPLYQYYPYDDIDYDDRYKLITARMVLSHTTGFPNWRAGGGSELFLRFDPGTQYGYSGEGYEYLSKVVKHLLNKKIEDVVEDEVFRPMSIYHSYLIKNDYAREHMAHGLKDNTEWGWNGNWQRGNVAFSLCTEAKEYSKFIMELMKESKSSSGIFHQMSAPQLEIDSVHHKWICLGVFMEQTPYGPKYSHSGNNNNRYTSNFEFYADKDLAYVFFMNCNQESAFTKCWNQFLESR